MKGDTIVRPMGFYTVSGEPKSWKAHKGFGKKSYSPNYNEKKSAKFELSRQHKKKKLYNEPIKVTFSFGMPIPKHLFKKYKKRLEEGEAIYHQKRPDCTNLQKFAEDCLIGTVIEDDNIVVDTRSVKVYAVEPKTYIIIEKAV